MRIKEFMIHDVISVNEDTTVKELLSILVSKRIGGVPVVSGDDILVGVISDGDVIRYLRPSSRTVFDMFAVVMVSEQEKLTDKLHYALKEPVSKMMKTKDIKSLSPEHDLEDALQIFSQHRFKKIPILDDNKKVVGVLSRGDLLRHITFKIIEEN
jgi:CBS domain-containing protein